MKCMHDHFVHDVTFNNEYIRFVANNIPEVQRQSISEIDADQPPSRYNKSLFMHPGLSLLMMTTIPSQRTD